MHPLKAWIDLHTTQAKFARDVECSEPHLSDILGGKKRPSLGLAAKMSRATGGAVPLDAFVGADAGVAQ